LYKEGSNSAIVTKDAEDFTGSYTVDMSLSQSISADATEKYVLKATLEDGTVTVL
jgi:hypothetical protein